MQATRLGRKLRPRLVSTSSIAVMIICLMVKEVYNRSAGLGSLGNGPAKLGFNSHVMKETVDHSKLHHLGEQAHHNQTHSEGLKSSIPKKPKPPPPVIPFPPPILTSHCPSSKSGHSMVDQLISKKMNIPVKEAPCDGVLKIIKSQ